MNVLFIDPPSLTGEVSESIGDKKLSTPNMGIIYIATNLKVKSDANIMVLDMATYNLNCDDIASIVKDLKPSLIAISSKTFNILSAYKIARIIKNISKKIILVFGGPHVTTLPEFSLKECQDIDAVIIQEGEDSIIELYKKMKIGYDFPDEVFEQLEGVVWRNRYGDIIRNNERQLIKDLDSLTFPDLTLLDYQKYRRLYNPTLYKFQHVYPIFGSRGCPFNCTFCVQLYNKKYRIRSIENILDEIELLNKRYNAKRIYFEDSLFCLGENNFEEFCNAFISRGLHKKIQWGFETRIDTQ